MKTYRNILSCLIFFLPILRVYGQEEISRKSVLSKGEMMTKRGKYILFGILGLVFGGGALLVGGAVIIGLIYFAADASDVNRAQKKDSPAIEKTQKPYKDSEIEKLVEFHEWAAEIEFTENQQQKFEFFINRDFQRDAEKARRETDNLIEAYAQIKAAEKDVQQLTRQLLVSATIEDLKKKNDDFSAFLLGIYEKKAEKSNFK